MLVHYVLRSRYAIAGHFSAPTQLFSWSQTTTRHIRPLLAEIITSYRTAHGWPWSGDDKGAPHSRVLQQAAECGPAVIMRC